MGVREQVELIPGTEVVFAGTDGESAASQQLVLIPQPTNNPDDPLNWSSKWKTIIIFNQFVFVFVSILTPLSIAPLTQIFTAEFQKTIPQVNLLFGVAAIVLGYANFLIVPLANVYGRRPIIILCGLVCILANIWQALVTSFPSFLGARVISGLGAAANESIMPMVVSDLLFVHQRGRSMALYFWAYFLGIFIGPIIAGSIAARVNWRWFFWVCAILQGASLVFLIVAHPETKYSRPSSHNVGPGPAALRRRGNTEEDAADEKVGGGDDDAVSRSSGNKHQAGVTSNTILSAVDERPVGGPSREQFSLIPKPRFSHGMSSVVRDVLSPLQIFSFPIVLWAALSMGFAANCLLALNLTESQVFAAPPYLFGAAQVGYTNFAFFVGAVIALVTAGPLSDWIALRKARRNGGVLEAEFRLLSVLPYVVACLVGMVVTAVGYQRGWHWQITVVVGYGLVGVQVVGIPAVVISYAVDSYKSLPGEIMIAATVVKNSFGFAMVFFFNDWSERQGYIAPVLTLMAITVGLSLLGLAVFIPRGKTFRMATKNSNLHLL
ncbi:hypothetical protein N0V82_009584 [Gnomoniopsis sp. IMI 355080]|nr:hypothetical protein N0V82_009584 [Gnomoniopsis sp. IMI 355080]